MVLETVRLKVLVVIYGGLPANETSMETSDLVQGRTCWKVSYNKHDAEVFLCSDLVSICNIVELSHAVTLER